MSDKYYLIIVRQCNDCGGNVTLKLMNKEPTEKEIEEVEREAGWSYCQTTNNCKEIELNEIMDFEDSDD